MNNQSLLFEHFQRIKILDFMTTMLGNFAVSRGAETFFDYLDMNCGAIPEGDFNQIIDPSAPEQFLSLYTGIANKRFAFAVNGLLKISPELFSAIKDFCYRTGKDMKVPGDQLLSARNAYDCLCLFVLDGMPGEETKQILSETENQIESKIVSKIEWKKITETHGDAWEKAGGKLEVYYELQEAFVNGLIESGGFEYKISGMENFCIQKK